MRRFWRVATGWVWLLLGLLCSCATIRPATDAVRFQFHLEASSATSLERRITVTLPVSGSRVAVDELPVIDRRDVLGVDLAEVALGPCLRFSLKPAAARALYRLTVENRGKRLVLFVDGDPLGVRVIDAVLADGLLFTFVEVPDAELPGLVRRMQAAL